MDDKVPLSFEVDAQRAEEIERCLNLAKQAEDKAKALKERSRERNRVAWHFRQTAARLEGKAAPARGA